MITSNTKIVDFLNSEHLNMNTRLLTLLHYIQSDQNMSSMLQHEDQVVLTAFIDFLTLQ